MGCCCCGGPISSGCADEFCVCDTSYVYTVNPEFVSGDDPVAACCDGWNHAWQLEWIVGYTSGFFNCAWRDDHLESGCTHQLYTHMWVFAANSPDVPSDNPCRIFLDFSWNSGANQPASQRAVYTSESFDCESGATFSKLAEYACEGWPNSVTVLKV